MSADLEKLLAEATEIAAERREKATESHMTAMMIRHSTNPGAAGSWQLAAEYAQKTARVLDQTADLARQVIALTAENAALRAKAEWRSIISAPKDGTKVDLWGVNLLTHDKREERIVNVAWGTVTDWMGRERDDWKHGRGEDFQPTYWRPQPDPPEETP